MTNKQKQELIELENTVYSLEDKLEMFDNECNNDFAKMQLSWKDPTRIEIEKLLERKRDSLIGVYESLMECEEL